MPGTDHAGIATQTAVERRLLQDGKRRSDYTRDAFVELIHAWKDEYGATILSQLKELGASCDWQRTRFTMDPVCAAAVREAFFQLFDEGLIFRGKRLVNWDPPLERHWPTMKWRWKRSRGTCTTCAIRFRTARAM